MTTDIDPAFADRCEDAATSLRLLAELGAHPDSGGPDDEDLAERLAERILADPEALLAVALVIEQQRYRAALRPAAIAETPVPTAHPDDLSTLGRGETRLVGGKMWARCEDCGFVGPLAGLGTWHVCDPVTEPGPLARQR